MLGFDYFTLLDHLTIARSRKHIEKYYGTAKPVAFPTACPPSTSRPTWTGRASSAPSATSTRDPAPQPGRYAPLRYVLPHKQAAYDAKYSTQIAAARASSARSTAKKA
jgi:hypothetical protein